MDRKYYSRIGSYLTPEQIRHEDESSSKIFDKYRISNTGMLGTFIGVGGVTFLAIKRRGPITISNFSKVLDSTITGGLTTFVADAFVTLVSVFFQMIIIS